MQGKMKWFNVQMGYGFITGEDGKDYFVHRSAIVDGRQYIGVDKDDAVTFDPCQSKDPKKGPMATNLALMTTAPATSAAPVDPVQEKSE